ncbi:unnamed protein product [Calypogeia fissa]
MAIAIAACWLVKWPNEDLSSDVGLRTSAAVVIVRRRFFVVSRRRLVVVVVVGQLGSIRERMGRQMAEAELIAHCALFRLQRLEVPVTSGGSTVAKAERLQRD